VGGVQDDGDLGVVGEQSFGCLGAGSVPAFGGRGR
jgi:hypothetical protein